MIRLTDIEGATSLLTNCLSRISKGEFSELVAEGKAGPSTSSEYQSAYEKYLGKIKPDFPEEKKLEQLELIPTKQKDKFRVEVDLFSNNEPTDVTLIFYLLSSEKSVKHIYLYDIIVL